MRINYDEFNTWKDGLENDEAKEFKALWLAQNKETGAHSSFEEFLMDRFLEWEEAERESFEGDK